ncbi:histidine phosphatase family protein [Marmoricola sp. URHB0036]|uniref:SixA phosphatase family protein n=1 Tax=Marmoricola sp. URHB0036 TaxID=1298863 RepID=UPI0009DC2082
MTTRHTLILLRHAKSDWSGDEPDRLRPLAPRGRRQAPEAGRWLADCGGRLDLALVSSATRAQQTWQLASAELADPPPVRTEDGVYAASVGELLDVVRDLPDEVGTVVMVGHNPGFEDLATALSGQPVPMPTSALAVLDLAGDWRTAGILEAHLRTSGRPPG